MLSETAAAFKMTAPTFKLFTNKNNFKSIAIVLRHLHFFSLQINQQNFVVGFPGDAVTNFLVTFETSTLRWFVSVALWVDLIWHFVWGPNLTFWPLPRAHLPGRVFKFTLLMGCWFQNFWCSLMLRGSTGPSRDDFCLTFAFFLLR